MSFDCLESFLVLVQLLVGFCKLIVSNLKLMVILSIVGAFLFYRLQILFWEWIKPLDLRLSRLGQPLKLSEKRLITQCDLLNLEFCLRTFHYLLYICLLSFVLEIILHIVHLEDLTFHLLNELFTILQRPQLLLVLIKLLWASDSDPIPTSWLLSTRGGLPSKATTLLARWLSQLFVSARADRANPWLDPWAYSWNRPRRLSCRCNTLLSWTADLAWRDSTDFLDDSHSLWPLIYHLG